MNVLTSSFLGSSSRVALLGLAAGAGTALAAGSVAAQVSEMSGPTLRAGLNLEINTLDPALATNTAETIATINLYDTLVYPDAKEGVIPWMLEGWEVSEDKKSYTLTLRDDLLFHDGTKVDAEDAAFSMLRAVEMPSMIGNYVRNVDSENIEVLDPLTVRFNLTEVDPAFLRALTWLKIVNKDLLMENLEDGAYGEYGDFGSGYLKTNEAGSGPYQLTDYTSSVGVELAAFPEYKLIERAENAPARVELEIIPEFVTIETKAMAGEFDLDLFTPAPARLEVFEDTGNFTFPSWQTLNTYYVTMNTTKPPLDDINVRKAISHAYDRETVMNKIFSGGVPLEGPVPEILMGGEGACDDLVAYDYDLEKAQEYIEKSKYSAEELADMTMEIAAVAGSQNFQQVALLLSLNLKKIGLTAEIVPVRWTDITAAQTEPESAYHFVFFFDSTRLQHPSQLMVYFTEKGWGLPYPTGGVYWSDPEVTELFTEAGLAPDGSEEQNDLYCDASKIIAEAAPVVFSHNATYVMPAWDYLTPATGEKTGSTYHAQRFDEYRFDMDSPKYQQNHGR